MNKLTGLVLALLIFSGLPSIGQELVTEVKVHGNLRIESEVILGELTTRAGQPYDADTVRNDIQKIFAMKKFVDVAAEMDGNGRLTFLVIERPALRDWIAEGSDEIDPEDLEVAAGLRKGDILPVGTEERATRAIRELYREEGYFLAKVRPELVEVERGTNQVDLVFHIDQGDKVRVKRFHVLGVPDEDREDMDGYLATREAGPWSWFSESGTFAEVNLERDKDVVKAYLLNQGYAKAEVADPVVAVTPDRKWVNIDVPTQPGRKYTIGTIEFSGELEEEVEVFEEAAGLKTGELFHLERLQAAIQRIRDVYADIGYAYARVNPRMRFDEISGIIHFNFDIKKGDLIYIGRIEAHGNVTTRDRVIRRDIKVAEGEVYNASVLRRSKRRLMNLNFFESVEITTTRRPGTNIVDIDVEVLEKSTGTFSFGAAYSTVDYLMGMVAVKKANLMGMGYNLAFQANVGVAKETYSLNFANPRLFDSNVYYGIDFYKSFYEASEYDKDTLGGNMLWGYSFAEDWSTSLRYTWERADVGSVEDDASRIIREQEGTSVTSSLSPRIGYDSRDNKWETNSGLHSTASAEWAGTILGGDNDFLKLTGDGAYYQPLFWKFVFMLHGRIGFMTKLAESPLPIYERYTLGGINTVRGYKYRSIGPVDVTQTVDDNGTPSDPSDDITTTSEDVIGGDKMLLFNAELLFPLIEEAKVRGVLFFDAGNAWDVGERYLETELKRSVGGGIRWASPMGPLRLEYGYKLDRETNEDRGRWEFSIGGFF